MKRSSWNSLSRNLVIRGAAPPDPDRFIAHLPPSLRLSALHDGKRVLAIVAEPRVCRHRVSCSEVRDIASEWAKRRSKRTGRVVAARWRRAISDPATKANDLLGLRLELPRLCRRLPSQVKGTYDM